MEIKDISVIGFDADDTLWHNEEGFAATERELARRLLPFIGETELFTRIYDKQKKSLPFYGYGIKSFTLAMIELSLEIAGTDLPVSVIPWLLERGKEMLSAPVELLPGVSSVLRQLHGLNKYRLVLVTKGDLLDQERKLSLSGLAAYFQHVEIASHKNAFAYKNLCEYLDIKPKQFLMVGNSLHSDVLPVLEVGGSAFHVPYLSSRKYKPEGAAPRHPAYVKCEHLEDILPYFVKK